jgi:hypothetical protein
VLNRIDVSNNPVNYVDWLGLVKSAGELGIGNPGSYGGENTHDSMYGSNRRGTGNDFDGDGSCGQGGRPNSWDRREPFDWSPYEGFEVEPPEVNDNVKGAVGMGLILAGAAMAGVELGNPFDKPTKAVDLLKALPEGGHRLTKIGVGATLMKIGIDMVMDAWPGGIAGGAGVNPGVGDGLYGDDSIGP